MSEETTLETKGLDQLLKALKAKAPLARVGILGSKGIAPHGDNNGSNPPTNAEIGAFHEFGTVTMPQRSFLRMPISENLDKQMEASGALDKDVMKEVIKSGSVLPWMKKITILAESIVREAFNTGGYGKWAPWKTKGYSNNTGMILVDTTQLRDSITSEVKENG